ncbi:hypothetical protein RIVM261_048290 [Rivularia sp. IAM M-261]|nr:hypothetical protein RIVM261_048290 [Rivularia sp. IAM M-261]
MPAKPKQKMVRFEMLLTKEQNNSLVQVADSLGISKAELVRRRIAQCRIKTIPQVNWQCYWQLLKIAEDINYIAQTQNNAMGNSSAPPAINPIMIEELMKNISEIRLHLIVGAKALNKQLEENDDWEN